MITPLSDTGPRYEISSCMRQQRFLGWYWAVWQDGKLVGFGAGYREKRRCLRHQLVCLKRARVAVLPEVVCSNPVILGHGDG